MPVKSGRPVISGHQVSRKNNLFHGPFLCGGLNLIKGRNTVHVEIFAQYIFSCNSRMALCARKYDVSENLNQFASNRIKLLCARKFVCAKMPDRARCAKI